MEDKSTHDRRHSFHLVDPSPWPLIAAIAVLILAIGGVLLMHHLDRIVFFIGVGLLAFTFFGWWRDVIREGNTKGIHTKAVQSGLKIGMGLFIASEVMFFVAFFWGYFHVAFDPPAIIGSVWPPKNIITLDPFELPYLNTLLLLLSGTTVTWAHHAMLEDKQSDVIKGLMLTVCLGVFFTIVQGIEYYHAPFALKDGIYPSSFYMATGFHGLHVIIGTIFLGVCLFRAHHGEFTSTHHVGFEAAAWYWHFVDVIWLFLFIAIYWWSYNPEAATLVTPHGHS